jgi:hypothetical protein
VIDISQEVGTKALDRLWTQYAGTEPSMPPEKAHKFLKEFAKVFSIFPNFCGYFRCFNSGGGSVAYC